MLPIVAMLLQNGLGILGNALLTKGKDVIEDKLGVKLEPNMTQDQLLQLKQLEFQNEQWLVTATQNARDAELTAMAAEDTNVTDRWKSDMSADSWLSKNIRPMVLLYLLGSYTILSLMSAIGWDVNESYVTLLGQWGMLVMTAYFGSRGLEKVISIKNKDTK